MVDGDLLLFHSGAPSGGPGLSLRPHLPHLRRWRSVNGPLFHPAKTQPVCVLSHRRGGDDLVGVFRGVASGDHHPRALLGLLPVPLQHQGPGMPVGGPGVGCAVLCGDLLDSPRRGRHLSDHPRLAGEHPVRGLTGHSAGGRHPHHPAPGVGVSAGGEAGRRPGRGTGPVLSGQSRAGSNAGKPVRRPAQQLQPASGPVGTVFPLLPPQILQHASDQPLCQPHR